jgi:hypothetical protein
MSIAEEPQARLRWGQPILTEGRLATSLLELLGDRLTVLQQFDLGACDT